MASPSNSLIQQASATSTDEAESIGIAKSREAMAEADIVLLVLDATTPIHPEDEATIASLRTALSSSSSTR